MWGAYCGRYGIWVHLARCTSRGTTEESLHEWGCHVMLMSAKDEKKPKQIHEIKDFLLTARWKDAHSVKIKKSKDVVKFKFLARSSPAPAKASSEDKCCGRTDDVSVRFERPGGIPSHCGEEGCPLVKIKRSKDVVKFKVHCSKYLYALDVFDAEKANKLEQSLPAVDDLAFIDPGLSVHEV
ncbi:hypothetical protein E2562_037964 [Oryza meyeriana var. granulata]|uniref:Uncharacterized protein n=1 Tax=Oryza meyeriana var. granulata TaxID=110450 RepID=A0A6G1CLS8_9ORYZ|nr:hypothetical protein E2562_037964 [Oryza meyeriana var. granulata]KAF0901107.1 hypothetical protein E2562_037964 [Oryza meyeriana var. granulata]